MYEVAPVDTTSYSIAVLRDLTGALHACQVLATLGHANRQEQH